MIILVFLILFIPCCAATGYDNMFRNFYMPMAAAAYSDNPQPCLSAINNLWYSGDDPPVNVSLYRTYKIKCDSLNDTCSGYTGVIKFFNYDGSGISIDIIIAFSGTTNYDQLYGEAWNYTKTVPFGWGKVDKHFFGAFNGIWISGMKDDVLTLKNKYPVEFVYVLGHSMGGAMASLAAATIASMQFTGLATIELFTYGQPRTGDRNYADYVNDRLVDAYRVVHNKDIVPHLPPLNDSLYYHHVSEFWYPNDMAVSDSAIGCSPTDGEDSTCSNSLHDYNIKDHKYYYGREFSDFGVKGCPGMVNSIQMQLKNVAPKRPKLYSSKTIQNIKL